jgi:hypothetical protein
MARALRKALHDHSLSEVIRISIACVRGYLISHPIVQTCISYRYRKHVLIQLSSFANSDITCDCIVKDNKMILLLDRFFPILGQ